MKANIFVLVVAAMLAALPAQAQNWSWDPMQAVESVLPEGVPNEGKIIQARLQVRDMAQDALASLYEISPGARRAVERSAGYAVFSTFGIKLFFAGGTSGKGSQQGWEFGAQANVAAMAGGAGGMFTGAAAISPGVYVYQLTDTGLAATLTVASTKFFKDGDLN